MKTAIDNFLGECDNDLEFGIQEPLLDLEAAIERGERPDVAASLAPVRKVLALWTARLDAIEHAAR